MKIPKSLKILGKVWSLEYPAKRLPPDRWGDCDSPETPKRKIRIHKDIDVNSKQFLNIFLHEYTHAGEFTKDESWVKEFSDDLTKILWKMGYRKVETTRKRNKAK